MTRPAAIARRVTRRTLSRQMAETLAETASKSGMTAAIFYPAVFGKHHRIKALWGV